MAQFIKCDFCGEEHKKHYFQHNEPMPENSMATIVLTINDQTTYGSTNKDICSKCLSKYGLEKIAVPRGRTNEDGAELLDRFIAALQELNDR